MLNWARGKKAANEEIGRRAGEPIDIAAPKEAKSLILTGPDGAAWRLQPDSNGRAPFDKTFMCGYYKLEADGRTVDEYGVSLLDGAESDIAPRLSAQIGGTTAAGAFSETRRTNQEIWRWLVAAALGFLILEWIVYHRRIWV